MTDYVVSVIIENKPGISDPEGETILNDLVLKGKNRSIKKIRSGTILKFSITEKNEKIAKDKVVKICDEMRIYNPLVSMVTATVKKD
jgi:phosphoribosylformylglycinamidine synthase